MVKGLMSEEKFLLVNAKLVVENPLASTEIVPSRLVSSAISETVSPLFALSMALHDILTNALYGDVEEYDF